jgi:hypothetical protein
MEWIEKKGRALVSYRVIDIAMKEPRQAPQIFSGSMELGDSLEDGRVALQNA